MAVKPFKFMSEVKSEVTKVVWPSASATYRMTSMVFIMVAFMAIYLLVVDTVLSQLVKLVLEMGN
ncbi:MAG: preprotein translocase subunit SecE [Proteobacteria bacterium]|nr:preprotein translocase subunit SecE [Pseudomonadota bacterium]